MARDIVLILEGGTMLGVYGAGVVTVLQEEDLYHRIHSIYSVSAGAHNAAYFLSRQTRLASTIYYDDLSSDAFIHRDRFLGFVRQGLTQPWQWERLIVPVVDLDYLEYVESEVKPMDLTTLRQQQIPWYVRVFNVDSLEWEYLNGYQDTLATIKASATLMPLYPRPITIRGKRYIDGSMIRTKDFLTIARQHADKKVVYVRNVPQSVSKTALQIIPRLFDTVYTGLIFSWRLAWYKQRHMFASPSHREILQIAHVHLLQNTLPYSSNTTDTTALQQVYQHGIDATRQLLRTF